jgi:ribose transport system permease protein
MRWALRSLFSGGANEVALLIAVAIFIALALTTGGTFLTPENLENVTRQVSLDAPVVFGETVVLIAGGLDLAVGATMAMAAILTIGFQDLGTTIATVVALGFGLAVGAANGLLVTRARIIPFIATLGTMSVARGVMLTYTHQQPLSGSIEGFDFWGASSVGPVPVPLIVALGLAAMLFLWLRYTRFGRNLYSIGGNREAAYLAGISVDRHIFAAFVASGVLSALSGVLLASRLNSATVQLGNDTPLLALSAALIGGASLLGGRGTIGGALLGVLALGMLANGLDLLGVETYHQIAIRAAILILVVGADALLGNLAKRRSAGVGAVSSN